MFNNRKLIAAGTTALLIGLGAGGIAVNAHQTESETGDLIDAVRCEIVVSEKAGLTTLESVFHAEDAVSGTYRFRVVKSGGGGTSNISQGGNFAAGADENVTLGRVMLGGAGATYDVSLSVHANGEDYECSERFGDIA